MARHRNPVRKEMLHNRLSREDLLKKLDSEPQQKRRTLSFYRYTSIEDPRALRDSLYRRWASWDVRGRIYLAREGINAQLSVPLVYLREFQKDFEARPGFEAMRFNPGVEDDGNSFLKLTIKVKRFIVNDGLGDFSLQENTRAEHLKPADFNRALDEEGTVVIDMRNEYESEVGRFDGAICPDVQTFREELPAVATLLKEKSAKKILLYCTGGIRCEKAGAYLRKRGFANVYQLEGGVINYAHAVKREGLRSKFKGKNFVFDERLSERITDDVLAHCHTCGVSCDTQVNCANEGCHALMVQCDACRMRLGGACSEECRRVSLLPADERKALRQADATQREKPWFSKRIRVRVKPQSGTN